MLQTTDRFAIAYTRT